ncbi:hypothetical protein SeMB42_g05891 [Synchytrium endobioticum]|uniref:Uncharacterized protein n=1 Tax=Synchytrium endobioticum TaxID=286115 RepID=A0A507CNS6_9FUNG|nr:hypothetical protein SeMB42_g05891 [Synchytrium endobioticum]
MDLLVWLLFSGFLLALYEGARQRRVHTGSSTGGYKSEMLRRNPTPIELKPRDLTQFDALRAALLLPNKTLDHTQQEPGPSKPNIDPSNHDQKVAHNVISSRLGVTGRILP